MKKNIAELKTNVYNAINVYQNNGCHKLLKVYYKHIYNEYVEAGGKETLEQFEKNAIR